MHHRRYFLVGMVLLAAAMSPLQAQPSPPSSSNTPNSAVDAMEAFRAFVRDVKSGKAAFSQVVTSSDGVKKRNSSGTFEFARPNRFRFEYLKPYPQAIVGDGQKVWVHDPDLQQVTVRAMDKALGSTPMALLTGQDFEGDFDVKADGKNDAEGLAWVIATPRTKEGSVFESMRMGFKGKALVAVDILDALGQRTMLRFDNLVVGQSFGPEHFNFKVPSGTDVLNP
jgi:outer membrane lipoprotein carrier protein